MAMSDDEFDAYLAAAQDELDRKQQHLKTVYGLGTHQAFAVDYVSGTLDFIANEVPVVRASILPVATHNPEKGSLKWGWANQQLPDTVRADARRVSGLYDITGFDMFRNEALECEESMAWEVAALACKLLDAEGVYRVPHNAVNSYVLIKSLRNVV
jgi:hypothetical protein